MNEHKLLSVYEIDSSKRRVYMISEQEWIQFIENCFYGDTAEVKKALVNHILENINYEHFCELQDHFMFQRGRTWQLVKNRIDRNTKLIVAIIHHDEESVKKLIKYRNIDINYIYFDDRNSYPRTPILYNFNDDLICDIDILKCLLNAKQPIKQKDIQLSLLYCVSTNSFEGVTLLLDYGADINYILESGERALGIAISNGNVEVVKFLLSKGAEILESDYYSYLDLKKLSKEATGSRDMREISPFEIEAFIDYLSYKKYNEALEELNGSLHEDEYEIIQIRAKNIHKHFFENILCNIEKLLTEEYSFNVDNDQDFIAYIDSSFDPETAFQELTYSDLLGLDFNACLTDTS